MTAPARRTRYRKKRWAAAGVLWLLLAYPLSTGPGAYAIDRGWVEPSPAVHAFWSPLPPLFERLGLSPAYLRWCRWWSELAWAHRDAASD